MERNITWYEFIRQKFRKLKGFDLYDYENNVIV